MNYSQELREYHKERVREVIGINPRASERVIREILENHPTDPISLDRNYIRKIKAKVIESRKWRFNTALVEERLGEMQDRTESIISQMWLLLLDDRMNPKTRVDAAKTIIMAESKFWEAQLDAGVFEKHLGTVGFELNARSRPLELEKRIQILKAFESWGFKLPTEKQATVLAKEIASQPMKQIVAPIWRKDEKGIWVKITNDKSTVLATGK